MRKAGLFAIGAVAVIALSGVFVQEHLLAQGAAAATYITKEQVDAVNATPGTDRTLEVFDLGKTAMSIGIIHRGPTGGARGGAAGAANAARGAAAGAARGAGAGGGAGRANAAPQVPCGDKVATVPADATPGAIAHDQTTETYIIVSGSGTLVTGGKIVNGNRSAPDSEVTRVLNGPSCSGPTVGNVVKKVVKTGDIIVIPAGVPHGWTDIGDHVDYLSVRPDPDKVLEHGYVHPALKK
jgi:mannose-6-phosphate isomerase-like protein (cupin superfamily)